jgi:hypothetical protein
MGEEIIPFQVSKSMVICGNFRGETDESVYVWIRQFESKAKRSARRATTRATRLLHGLATGVAPCHPTSPRARPQVHAAARGVIQADGAVVVRLQVPMPTARREVNFARV